MMKLIKILWVFSRPHTIIGSFISIIALYAISIANVYPHEPLPYLQKYISTLTLTLISALACNLYITGLNQILDLDIDRINKPWLPIPSGQISQENAKIIVVAGLIISLIAAALVNYILLVLILIISALGSAYSLPPIKFKKHHMGAAMSILLVRGVLVNVGMTMQFIYAFTNHLKIPVSIWPLVFFVVGFSLGIAWFKDIPDTKGDDKFNIKTLAITLSPLAAFRYGVAVVAISYIGLISLEAILKTTSNEKFFFFSHGLLLLLFLIGAGQVKLDIGKNLKRFYLGFWVFFYVEYIVYPLSFYL